MIWVRPLRGGPGSRMSVCRRSRHRGRTGPALRGRLCGSGCLLEEALARPVVMASTARAVVRLPGRRWLWDPAPEGGVRPDLRVMPDAGARGRFGAREIPEALG